MSRSAFVEVNITNPTRLAQDSQDTANKAVKGVTNLNDPNLMNVIEKQNNVVQFAGLTSQYNVLLQNAKDEGIDTTAVTTAYNNLNRFMADVLADPDHASDVDRTTYKKYQDAYNTELSNLKNALQNNTNNKFASAASATSQAASTANIAKSAADSAYAYASSEIAIQSSAVANVQSTANSAFSQAQSAVSIANSTASAFGPVKQNADSALSGALSAQNAASSAVAKAESTASEFGKVSQKADSAVSSAIDAQSNASYAVAQASSAAADSKDAKQIAGAVNQSYKTLTDGSTMTIAELESGLAVKLTKNDLDGYATQDWSQNQIKTTADGINSTISSVKSTVDSQTTSINDLKADSNGFKDEFTKVNNTIGQHTTDIGTLQTDSSGFKAQFQTVNDTIGKHTTDIGSLQTTSKELSSNFSSLSTDNATNKTNISTLSQTVDGFKIDISKKLEQKDLNGYATQDWAQNQINTTADGINGTISSIKSTVDSQTTSINDLKADSSGFKAQFTTVNDTLGKQSTDIGTLQATSKELVSGFNTLTTDNGTNKNDISRLKQTATEFNSTLETVQTQVQDSAVGANLIIQSDLKPGYLDRDNDNVVLNGDDFHSENYMPTNGATVFTLSSPDYTFKGNGNTLLKMYDSDKNYLGYQTITSATQTLSKPNVAYIRLSVYFVGEGGTSGKLSDWLSTHRYKLEKGSVATDFSLNPADTATVTAVSSLSQTVDGIKTDVSKKIEQKDLNGYATETWTQGQIKLTADGLSGTLSSVKSTVDSQTTSINDLKADSSSFKSQFTNVTDTLGKHATDIGTLQSDAKSLSANFDSLDSDNTTNKHNISQLQLDSKSFSSTLTTVQQQVQDSAVGTNLLIGTHSDWQSYKIVDANDWAVADSFDLTNNDLDANTDYVFSSEIKSDNDSYTWHTEIGAWDSNGNYTIIGNSSRVGHGKSITTFNTGSYVKFNFRPHVGSNSGNITTVYWRHEKLEKGSIATDWCPNPADNATVTAVSSISQTIDGIKTAVSGKADSSQISQLRDDIDIRVKKDDLISDINAQAGHILISASHQLTLSSNTIYFDTANPVIIPSANIDTLLAKKTLTAADISANTFTTNNGTFTVDKDGLVTATSLIIRGSTNLVYNSSLAGANGAYIPGWNISNGGGCWISNTHDGVPSIGYHAFTGANNWTQFAQTKLHSLNGDVYQPFSASVWFKEYGSDTSLLWNLTLAFFDGNGNRIEGVFGGKAWNGIGSEQDWQYITAENITPPKNAVYVGLQYFAYNGHGNGCFSSPMLTQTAKATGYQPDTGNVVSAGTVIGTNIVGSNINGTTFNAGSIDNNDNNTAKFYPFTADSNGVLRSYHVDNYFANSARIYSGNIIISDRNMTTTDGNKYGGETAVLGGSSLTLSSGYTVGKDTDFTKPLVAEGEPGTTQLILSGINGITLKGDDQKIHFHGMYSDSQPKGITFTPYGNINGDEGSTTGNWYVGYNLANMTAQFGIDNLSKNTINFYRPLFVDEIGALDDRLGNGRLLLHAVDGNAQMYLLNDGTPAVVSPTIYNRTYSTGANMFITSYGRIGRATSASKYKLAINRSDDTVQADRLMTLKPASWNDKVATEKMAESLSNGEIPVEEEINLRRHYGLIAEDLRDAGLDEFLITGKNGQIEGIEYDRLWTVLIPKIKQLNNRINELERKTL